MADVTSAHSGFQSTQYGTPGASVPMRAFGASPSTVIPMAYTAVNRTGVHTGSRVTRFGSAMLNNPLVPGQNVTAQATGARVTQFGQHATPTNRSSTAQGTRATAVGFPGSLHLYAFSQVGTPMSTTGHAAASVGAVAQYGTPGAGDLSMATGWRVTQFGQAVATPGYVHRARTPQTRLGRHGSAQTGVHAAYGLWNPARFGWHQSTNRVEYPHAGLMPTAQIGTITAYEQHRASALPPVAAIGNHSLQRAATC